MDDSITVLSTLAHEGRLSALRLLIRRAPQAVRAGEIAHALGLKLNTASVYLGALERAGLVESQRLGREIHYAARPARVGALTDFLLNDCCHGRPELCAAPQPRHDRLKVLFVCSGNSTRSLMAEALMRAKCGDAFAPASAGLHPKDRANQAALALLAGDGIDTGGLEPKPLDLFRRPDAPRMDLVLTVCDRAANADVLSYPGHPVQAHWSLPDPSEPGLDPDDRARRLTEIRDRLLARISALTALARVPCDRASLQHAADSAAAL